MPIVKESLEIFDDGFHLIGTSEYDEVHKLGYWHRVIHCWIFDHGSGLLLYQKRGKSKRVYPGFLDVSVAGHCRPGEGIYETIIREGREELGINIDSNRLINIGIRKDSTSQGPLINREFQHIFMYEMALSPSVIKVNTEELEYVVLLKPDNVIRSLEGCQPVTGVQFLDNSVVAIAISHTEFIPSVDGYNLNIPQLVNGYLSSKSFQVQ